MKKTEIKALLISDFTIDTLAPCLALIESPLCVRAVAVPPGQVTMHLVNQAALLGAARYDVGVVWSRPETVLPSFKGVLAFDRVPTERLYEEVDEFSDLLAGLARELEFLFVPTWLVPSYFHGWGPLEMKNGYGIANTLSRVNLRLADRLEKFSNIFLMNSQRWIENAGSRAFQPKLWYMAKVPFSNDVFKEAARDIHAAIYGARGDAKRMVVVDLDDTMWGGIVGDVGWENLQLGGHDAVGEAFVDFQRALKALKNRGILLGIVSKNEESIALDAMRKHPEMILKPEDLAGWRINWDDKATNIEALATGLGLGVHSLVFIDDSAAERARVREAFPEILVPEWPEDKTQSVRALLSLRCFDVPVFTTEDLARHDMYQAEHRRESVRLQAGSLEDWLKRLDLRVVAEPLAPDNVKRAAQLFNKTNQLNLATRRMTEDHLLSWAKQDSRKVWVFRVSDRFGDSGLTGLTSLEVNDGSAQIVDFVLSCRVMGRRVEEAMLSVAMVSARRLGADCVLAVYSPTDRNRPCLDFFLRSGMQNDGNRFLWETASDYPLPDSVRLDIPKS